MSNSSCKDELSPDEVEKILLARGLSGGISLILSISSMLSLLLFKRFFPKYLRDICLTEGLLLYAAFTGVLRSIAVILQVHAVDYDPSSPSHSQQRLCRWTGFFDEWSIWSVELSIQVIMLVLLIQLAFPNGRGVEVSKKCWLKVLYVALPVAFPLLFVWIPFVTDNYGLAGGWCWIRARERDGTRAAGLAEGYIFYIVPFSIFQLLDLIIIAMIYPWLIWKKISPCRDRIQLLKAHAPFLGLALLSVIMQIFPLIQRYYVADPDKCNLDGPIGLWIVHAITSSSWGTLTALTIFSYLVCLRLVQHNDGDQKQMDDRAFLINTKSTI